MADELKPNPFCGHAVMRDYVANDQWNDITGTEPDTCGMCEEIFRMNDEDWNRRPIEDALRAEVARQIKENESLAEANLTYAMETKELRDEVERLKVAEGEAMLAVESQDVSIAALRAEVAALREQRDHKFEQFLDWRGIEVGEQCDRCQGAGSYMYSSTATWMGGIGGQAMTVGVCDKCWGSGKKNKPWTNLRAVMSMRDEIAALKSECAEAWRVHAEVVAGLQARLAKFEGPLTEAQAHLVFCNAPTFDIMQAFQVDAAIRAAREGER